MKFWLKQCILFVISTYISRVNGENVRKIAKTEISKCQYARQMIYNLVGHKILNKTLYYFKRYYFEILRYWRKCMKKFNIIEWFKILLHKLCHEYAKRIYKTAMPYIMIDVILIWFIQRSIAARRCACFIYYYVKLYKILQNPYIDIEWKENLKSIGTVMCFNEIIIRNFRYSS